MISLASNCMITKKLCISISKRDLTWQSELRIFPARSSQADFLSHFRGPLELCREAHSGIRFGLNESKPNGSKPTGRLSDRH